MNSQLDLLLSEGILDDVLGRLKSGKEAEVFRVVYRGQIVAAKVYKDRQQRSFQHNVAYKEGRKVRNSRTQRAIDKGSRFGRDEAEDAWKSSEANTLQLLHRQGVRVPTPVLFYEGVLLMELVNDADGDIAPRLIEAPIAPEDAGALYRDLRGQIIKVLCCDLIHGDLSPYNVLLGAAGPTIIDFPQAISAAHNSQSEGFFQRDFENILNFFAELDRRLSLHRGDGREIWRAYARRELSPDYVPATRAPAPPPPPRPPQAPWQGEQRPRQNDPRSGGPRYPSDQRPQEHRYRGPRPDQAPQGAPPLNHAPQQGPRQGDPRFHDRRPPRPQDPKPAPRPIEPAPVPVPEAARAPEWPSRPRVYEPPASGGRPQAPRAPEDQPRSRRTRSRRG